MFLLRSKQKLQAVNNKSCKEVFKNLPNSNKFNNVTTHRVLTYFKVIFNLRLTKMIKKN